MLRIGLLVITLSLTASAVAGQAPNGTYFVSRWREPQGASRGFWAGKRNLCSPAASAVPLKVSGIGLAPTAHIPITSVPAESTIKI